MLTIPSLVVLAASALIVYVSAQLTSQPLKECEYRFHRGFCLAVFVLGCVFRLASLTSLPYGLSPEEALVGVQAKALWQTGGFYPNGALTTMLAQWENEVTGPLLAVISAPFVGLMGISPLSVRLPLVLLSFAAMPAAYVLGNALSGKNAGRFMLVIYALCPYFVLGARMTCGANAALFMLPIAAALLVSGLKKPVYLYAGMAALALSAYTQEMMLLIVPLAVLGTAAVALIGGKNRLHALLAAALGVVLCVPAILTVYVNVNGLESFMLFDLVEIPNRGLYTKNLFVTLSAMPNRWIVMIELLVKLWCCIVGGIFQAVWLENIDAALFMPGGMLALTVVSIPLILLGTGVIVLRWIDRKACKAESAAPRAMIVVMFAAALLSITCFGDGGCYGIGGAPDVFDHANMFFFAAVLMTAGWRQMERKSRMGTRLLAVLLAVCIGGLGVHLFGGNYQENATTYFIGFSDACAHAKEIQDETGGKVNVTTAIYPHVQPSAAARVMYLYAIDADMRQTQNFDEFYAPALAQLDDEQIYVAQSTETFAWEWGDMEYDEFENFVVIHPNVKVE